MSGFFDSEIVKEQIKEMEDLQQEIIERTMSVLLWVDLKRRNMLN